MLYLKEEERQHNINKFQDKLIIGGGGEPASWKKKHETQKRHCYKQISGVCALIKEQNQTTISLLVCGHNYYYFWLQSGTHPVVENSWEDLYCVCHLLSLTFIDFTGFFLCLIVVSCPKSLKFRHPTSLIYYCYLYIFNLEQGSLSCPQLYREKLQTHETAQ